MPGDPGPMVRRRQLSAILRGYRVRLGLSAKEVAERLYESPSRITRIEKGQRNATLRDIRDLCDIYGLPEDVKEQLMNLARESREREWWQQAELNPALQILIGMEGSARSISEFEISLLPGLVQTRDYADAVIGRWIPHDEARRKRAVDVRMHRQEILQQLHPPTVRIVLDEAVVRRSIGGPDVMRKQLEHLMDLASTGVVELRIVAFSSGMHVGITNGFTVLEFGNLTSLEAEPAVPGVVYMETTEGDRHLDSVQAVEEHLSRFGRLHGQALSPEESMGMLRAIIDEI